MLMLLAAVVVIDAMQGLLLVLVATKSDIIVSCAEVKKVRRSSTDATRQEYRNSTFDFRFLLSMGINMHSIALSR